MLQVVLHNEKGEEVGQHSLRLPKESCVADVLQALGKQVGPPYSSRPMRLMEVFYAKIYKVRRPPCLPAGPMRNDTLQTPSVAVMQTSCGLFTLTCKGLLDD